MSKGEVKVVEIYLRIVEESVLPADVLIGKVDVCRPDLSFIRPAWGFVTRGYPP